MKIVDKTKYGIEILSIYSHGRYQQRFHRPHVYEQQKVPPVLCCSTGIKLFYCCNITTIKKLMMHVTNDSNLSCYIHVLLSLLTQV